MSAPATPPRYDVRQAAPADLETVLAMKLAAWREAYGHLRDESFFAAGNKRAGAFYRRHGFSDVGTPVPMAGSWEGLSEQLMARRGA